jgi:hypothetical protein
MTGRTTGYLATATREIGYSDAHEPFNADNVSNQLVSHVRQKKSGKVRGN